MPVTAKLSRNFYGRLGDDAVNELVDWFNSVDLDFRTELRTLNDLNYARFDAKVEQRFAEQDTRIERRFAEQDARLEGRFAQVDRQLAQLGVKIDSVAAATETRLIRWMFAFWTTTIVTQVGLFYALRAK